MGTKFQISCDITRTIYQRDGFRGFYRGYVAALCNYVPSSASWWTFYSVYQEVGSATAPDWAPHTAVQGTAAVLAGCTTSLITNPLDLIRTRVQVQRKASLTPSNTCGRRRDSIFSRRVLQHV